MSAYVAISEQGSTDTWRRQLALGREILAAFATPHDNATRPGQIVLIKRNDPYEPYVTAWLGRGDREWHAGHYFTELHHAQRDFIKRCEASMEYPA